MNQTCSKSEQNDKILTMTNNSNTNDNNGYDDNCDEKVVHGPVGPEQTSRENSPTMTNNNHNSSKKYHRHHLPFSIDALVGDVCNKTTKNGAVNNDCDGDGDSVDNDNSKVSKNISNGLPMDIWHQQMAEIKRIQQIYYQKFYNLNEYPITTSFATIPTVPTVATSSTNNNCDLSRYLESQEQLLAYYTNLFLQNSYQDHYLDSLKKYSTTRATAATATTLCNNNNNDNNDDDGDDDGNIQNVVKSSTKTSPLLLNKNHQIKKHSKSNSERFNNNHNADNYGDIGNDDDEDDDNDDDFSTSTTNDDPQRPQCSNNDDNDANGESVSNAALSSSSPTNKINNPYKCSIGTLKNNCNHSDALINDQFIDLRQTSNSDLNIDDHHPNDNGRIIGQNYYKSFQSYCDYDSLKAKTSNHHHHRALLSNNNNENTGDNLSPISNNKRILHSPSSLSASSSLVAGSSPTNTITETINNSNNDDNETTQPTTSTTGSQVAAAAAAFHFSNMFRKPKRIRTAFSPGQLLRLEEIFEKNRYVVGCERKQLARDLNLSETQIKVWFQNRRTKHKREKHINGGNHHHHNHHHHNHHHHHHHHSSSSSSSSPSASNHLLSHSFRQHSHSHLGADVKKFYGRSLNLSSMDITGSYLSNNNTAALLSPSSSSSPSIGNTNASNASNGINLAFNFKNSTNNNSSRTLLAK